MTSLSFQKIFCVCLFLAISGSFTQPSCADPDVGLIPLVSMAATTQSLIPIEDTAVHSHMNQVSIGVATVVALSGPSLTGLWDFENGSLEATVGNDLVFLGNAESPTQFGTTTSFGISDISGASAYVMKFAAYPNSDGIQMFPAIPANGGGSYVNQYSLVMDLLYPSSSAAAWRSIYQTNDANTNDGDFFLNPSNGVGIDGVYDGNFAPDTWHRLVISVDLTTSTMAKFIDGVLVGSQSLPEGIDGRWSLYTQLDYLPTLLFSDDSGDVAEGYVNSIAVFGCALSASDAATLGGPSAEGIFPSVEPEPTETPTASATGKATETPVETVFPTFTMTVTDTTTPVATLTGILTETPLTPTATLTGIVTETPLTPTATELVTRTNTFSGPSNTPTPTPATAIKGATITLLCDCSVGEFGNPDPIRFRIVGGILPGLEAPLVSCEIPDTLVDSMIDTSALVGLPCDEVKNRILRQFITDIQTQAAGVITGATVEGLPGVLAIQSTLSFYLGLCSVEVSGTDCDEQVCYPLTFRPIYNLADGLQGNEIEFPALFQCGLGFEAENFLEGTPTPTATITVTRTPVSMVTPTSTSTSTVTDTLVSTETFNPTSTGTEIMEITITPTDTSVETPTATATELPADSPTATGTTLTDTPTFTPEETLTIASTDTRTETPTETPTPSGTPTGTETFNCEQAMNLVLVCAGETSQNAAPFRIRLVPEFSASSCDSLPCGESPYVVIDIDPALIADDLPFDETPFDCHTALMYLADTIITQVNAQGFVASTGPSIGTVHIQGDVAFSACLCTDEAGLPCDQPNGWPIGFCGLGNLGDGIAGNEPSFDLASQSSLTSGLGVIAVPANCLEETPTMTLTSTMTPVSALTETPTNTLTETPTVSPTPTGTIECPVSFAWASSVTPLTEFTLNPPENSLGAPDGLATSFFNDNGAAALYGFASLSPQVPAENFASALGVSLAILSAADFVAFDGNGTPGRGFETSTWVFSDGIHSISIEHSYDSPMITDRVIALGNVTRIDLGSLFGFSTPGTGDYAYILFDISNQVDVTSASFTVELSAPGQAGTIPYSPDIDALGLLSVSSVCAVPTATASPTATVTETVTPTETVTETATPTDTVTESITATHTPIETATPSDTMTGIVTPTITATETATPTGTVTETATSSETELVTVSPTETATPTQTGTVTETTPPTMTSSPTVTATPTITPTPGCESGGYLLLTTGQIERIGHPVQINGGFFYGNDFARDLERAVADNGVGPKDDLVVLDGSGVASFVENPGDNIPQDFLFPPTTDFPIGRAVDLEMSPSSEGFWVLTDFGGIYRAGDTKEDFEPAMVTGTNVLPLGYDIPFGVFRNLRFPNPGGASIRAVALVVIDVNAPLNRAEGYIVIDSQGARYQFTPDLGRVAVGTYAGLPVNDPLKLLEPKIPTGASEPYDYTNSGYIWPFFPGQDIARDAEIFPGSQQGLVIFDGWGGIHPVPVDVPSNPVFFTRNEDPENPGTLITTVGMPYIVTGFDDPETAGDESDSAIYGADAYSIFTDFDFSVGCPEGGFYTLDKFGGIFVFGSARVAPDNLLPAWTLPFVTTQNAIDMELFGFEETNP